MVQPSLFTSPSDANSPPTGTGAGMPGNASSTLGAGTLSSSVGVEGSSLVAATPTPFFTGVLHGAVGYAQAPRGSDPFMSPRN